MEEFDIHSSGCSAKNTTRPSGKSISSAFPYSPGNTLVNCSLFGVLYSKTQSEENSSDRSLGVISETNCAPSGDAVLTRTGQVDLPIELLEPCGSTSIKSNNVRESSHRFKIAHATSRETIFILIAHTRGQRAAEEIATRFGWKLRPFPELLAIVRELNRLCDASK